MKMMNKISRAVFLAGIALFAMFPASAVEKDPYVNPTGSEFPILAYHAFRQELVNPENYKVLKQCGFNMGNGWVTDTELVSKSLTMAEDAGIKVLINMPGTRNPKDIPLITKKYDGYSATAGYLLWDEPVVSQFEKMAELISAVRGTSDKLAYINLLPNYASLKSIGAPSYKSYLEQFIAVAQPQFLSYDNYCIEEKEGKLVLRPGYFENLEIAKEVCQEHEIPLWTFCLSTAHFNYPVPNEAQLLFEAFTGIAYGSKCIQYYGYGSAGIAGKEVTTAPVDSLGKPRKVWYAIRKANTQIQNIGRILLDCDVKNVWHTGLEIPIGTKKLTSQELPGPFTRIVSGSKGVVISHLTNGKNNYLMIVNKDFEKSQRVNVEKRATVTRISTDGRLYADNSKSVTLKPGSCILYEW